MTHFDQSIRSFLAQAASESPTPGGGSVAALTAALGAAMLSMTANLTTGSKFAQVEAEMRRLADRMAQTIAECEAFLEADIQAFEQYMAALKLPKQTPEEVKNRREALAEAAKRATEVPLQLAERCQDTLGDVLTVADVVNGHVVSDLGVAALLLEAAAQSALLTVDINLPALRDESLRANLAQRRDQVRQALSERKAAALLMVKRRLANG